MQVARSDQKGSWYFYLTAMLMGFMTFEAYINFLGTKLEPELWKDERSTFKERPYKGTNGKLLKLCEMHGVPFPEKGRRPFQTVCRLNELRDIVAHGKPDEFEFTVRHPAAKNPTTIKYSLDDYVSARKAERAISDLQTVVESLHEKFVARIGADLLLPRALDGALASSIGHMSEA